MTVHVGHCPDFAVLVNPGLRVSPFPTFETLGRYHVSSHVPQITPESGARIDVRGMCRRREGQGSESMQALGACPVWWLVVGWYWSTGWGGDRCRSWDRVLGFRPVSSLFLGFLLSWQGGCVQLSQGMGDGCIVEEHDSWGQLPPKEPFLGPGEGRSARIPWLLVAPRTPNRFCHGCAIAPRGQTTVQQSPEWPALRDGTGRSGPYTPEL